MLPTLIEDPFSDGDWIFEPKLDGYRVLALVQDGRVSLRSRNWTDFTPKFPDIASELQGPGEAVLDGEIVAINDEGLPDFQLLQNSANWRFRSASERQPRALVYYVFDLLSSNGRDLLRVPLTERKELLSKAVNPGNDVKLVEYVVYQIS